MSDDINFELLKTNTITNLKTISKLEIDDKLQYQNSIFYIDKWYYLQPIKRWYYNESRDTTIKHLQDFVESVFNLIEIIYSNQFTSLEHNYYIPVSKQPTFTEEYSSLLISLVTELDNSLLGFNNLKKTYKGDINIVNALNILIEKIQIRIKKIRGTLSSTIK